MLFFTFMLNNMKFLQKEFLLLVLGISHIRML